MNWKLDPFSASSLPDKLLQALDQTSEAFSISRNDKKCHMQIISATPPFSIFFGADKECGGFLSDSNKWG
ncbi:hypothetical protein M9458_046307, partial [Cirrhinus mrigala]